MIADAFSLTAEKYDRFAEDHPNLTRMRQKVYAHALRWLPPGAHILELNGGSGTDAVALAQQGFHVHATDIAPGMLDRLREKISRQQLADRVTVQECSFLALDQVRGGPFDAVFSDLGGLNCTADLRPVTQSLPGLLRPRGVAIWVLMPPICLWELATALTGNLRFAFRRLARGGTRAHLEGKVFRVYYFTPRQVIASFGPRFSPLAVEGLSVFAPPAEIKDLPKRHPRFYSALCRIDDRLAYRPPFSGWGDFFIVTMRYVP
jgi:ubiquinone/menaquinone biosynthesis C-methylase UbiE